MGTRSAHQCRGRWKSYLLPNIKNPPWTDEEDVLLEKYYQIYGNKWTLISKHFKNRSHINIKNRWTSLNNKPLNGIVQQTKEEVETKSSPDINPNDRMPNPNLVKITSPRENDQENLLIDFWDDIQFDPEGY